MTYKTCVVALALCAAWAALPANDDPEEFIEWKDVRFPHALHFDDLGVECETCHHETNAAALSMPHTEYFEDLWIDCTTCHKRGPDAMGSMSCSSCHHNSTTDIADQTLSSKVVIHKSCWSCHETGTGAEASRACKTCHKRLHPSPPTTGDKAEQPD